MKNPWTMKMEQFARFNPEERQRLDALIHGKRQESTQSVIQTALDKILRLSG